MRYLFIFSLILVYTLINSPLSWGKSTGYYTRYYYKGQFDKEKQQWSFSNPKTLYTYIKNGKFKAKPVFQNNEKVYIVTYSRDKKIYRVLRLVYWVSRSGSFEKPLGIFEVSHYNQLGEIISKAIYNHKIGKKFLQKVIHYKNGVMIGIDVYKNGKRLLKK